MRWKASTAIWNRNWAIIGEWVWRGKLRFFPGIWRLPDRWVTKTWRNYGSIKNWSFHALSHRLLLLNYTVLSVTVERTTRYTIMTKLKDRTATTKANAVIQQLQLFPSTARRSLTADNGLENIQHQRVTQETGMPVYFCHAYHSWEKGTVENMNGRIRRFIPKGVSMDKISPTFVQAIENSLNTTPRKCLQYRTPREMMNKLQTTTC